MRYDEVPEMNHFVYQTTEIIQSQFDFSRIREKENFSGEAYVSVSISVPKNPESNRTVECNLDLSIGSEKDVLQLRVQSQSLFEIEGDITPETLEEDAKNQCYPLASRELSERVAGLTELHIGKPLRIPIPENIG